MDLPFSLSEDELEYIVAEAASRLVDRGCGLKKSILEALELAIENDQVAAFRDDRRETLFLEQEYGYLKPSPLQDLFVEHIKSLLLSKPFLERAVSKHKSIDQSRLYLVEYFAAY